ncbi:MAG: right-handed parallel beta-helix repeat-containing protein [Saprospiraceae bacterium]
MNIIHRSNFTFLYLLFFISSIFIFENCRPDEDFITDQGAGLEFSLDTLRFDTVFTELGSSTRYFKVYNPHNKPIKIEKISLENHTGARFIINVDGIPGNMQEGVEINANDSIYVFAEVTVNPDAPLSESPFVINEDIVFQTNGESQIVKLEAWGQNANYFPNRFGGGGIWSPCTSPTVTWDDPKPYVIYGILAIDNCLLSIPEGTQIYVHGGITRNTQLGVYNDGLIIVLEDGRLQVNGTLEKPVTIQGDRLEDEFENRSGQWSGIIIDNKSIGNIFNHTTIKNSILGVAVDSNAVLTMRNVQIYNTSSAGLAGIHSTINAENCLVHSNGASSLQIAFGGNYNFKYCTFASYGVDAPAVSLSNGVCYDPPFCDNINAYRLKADFQNSIIFGSRNDELSLVDYEFNNAGFDYNFENCIVKVRELLDPDKGGFPDFFQNCIPCINATSQDILFENPSEDDYHLDSLSIAEKQAIPIPGIGFDLEGVVRDNATPDIGCFEYIPR